MMMTLTMMLALASCAKEDLCEFDHPHTSGITFTYDWSQVEDLGASRPDSMYILLDRVIYQETSSIGYDSWNETGHFLSVPDSASDEQRAQMEGSYDIYTINSSYYKFLTVNNASKVFDLSVIENFFNAHTTEVIPDLELPYRTYGSSEIKLGDNTIWTDYNDYKHADGTSAQFIYSGAAVAIDSTKVYEVPKGDTLNINFTPTLITHSIDIYFDINKDVSETEFVIDSVYAVISGIPASISLRSNSINIGTTNKLLQKFTLVSPLSVPTITTPKMTDTETNKLVRCFANINVTGIVENGNMDAKKYNGPGVMQLIVFCKVKNADGTWPKQEKTVNGLVNIHNALTKAGLQVYDYDKNCWVKSEYYTQMPIELNFTIDKKALVGDESEGIPEWQDGGDIGTDV